MKLDRNRCRKIEWINIPHSKNSKCITDGWHVCSFTDGSTKIAKSLTPLLEGEGGGPANSGERWIGEAR